MLYDGHHWRCTWCGTILGERPADGWRTEVRGQSGQPNMHVVIVDGQELHQCQVDGGAVSGACGSTGALTPERGRSPIPVPINRVPGSPNPSA